MTDMANLRPIQVTVTPTKWNAYALTSIPTPRDIELIKILNEMGGINESVVPGVYHFNVTPIVINEIEQHVATLYPAK